MGHTTVVCASAGAVCGSGAKPRVNATDAATNSNACALNVSDNNVVRRICPPPISPRDCGDAHHRSHAQTSFTKNDSKAVKEFM